MRILIGFLAMILWSLFMGAVMAKTGIELSKETQWLTMAIIAAGAMAGGDD